MNPFSYVKPATISDALREHRDAHHASFLGGGTNLVDLMKENVARPRRLIDLQGLPLRSIDATDGGGLRIGALVTNADVAYHPEIERRYPLLSKAILAGASPQLRNMATTGGNLLQRTRCYYFYDPSLPCNKRSPGSGCPAIAGQNRIHAILGTSEACIATHPSDMCVALAALGAVVHVLSEDGPRAIPFADVHRLPGDAPERDTNLGEGELVTAVELPAEGFGAHSSYLKLRDRASYAFALVSVAAALRIDQGAVQEARIALGGVAAKPWRLPEAERLLHGQAPEAAAFRRVADAYLEGARGYGHNDFKIPLAKRAIVRALHEAATSVEANHGK